MEKLKSLKTSLKKKMTINSVTKVYGAKLLFSDFLKKIGKSCENEEEKMELEIDYRFEIFEKGTVVSSSKSGEIPDTLVSFVRTHDIEQDEKTEGTHIIIGLVVSHDIINDDNCPKNSWENQNTPYTQTLEDLLKIVEKYNEISKKHFISEIKPAFYTIYDDCGCCS